MHNFERGFLSEPFDDVRIAVRLNHTPWHALLHEINISTVALQHNISVRIAELREVFGAALFARIISSSQGAVILLEHGLVAQGRCVLRCALESLFALGAISEKPEFVNRLVEAHRAEQRRIAKNISLWQEPELKTLAEAQRNSGRLAKFLSDKAKSIQTIDLAQAGGYEDWYRSIYMSLSWSVHSAALDLERHLVKDGEGNITGMRNEPDIERQEVAWLIAADVQLKAVDELGRIFAFVDQTVFKQYEDRLYHLAKTIQG